MTTPCSLNAFPNTTVSSNTPVFQLGKGMKTHSLVPSAHILLYKCLPKHLRQGFTCLCWEMLNCHSVFFASYLLMRQEARHRGFLSGFSIFFLFCCVLTKQCFSLPIPLNRMRTCYPQSKTLSTVRRSNDTKQPLELGLFLTNY